MRGAEVQEKKPYFLSGTVQSCNEDLVKTLCTGISFLLLLPLRPKNQICTLSLATLGSANHY